MYYVRQLLCRLLPSYTLGPHEFACIKFMTFQLSERFGLFGMSLRNIFPANFQQLFPSKRVILDARASDTDANLIFVMPKVVFST